MKNKISRLSFIKQSGVVAGGLSTGLIPGSAISACNRKANPLPLNLPKDKIRLGIIGTGQRFVEQLTLSLKYLPNFEIIACSDLIPGRLANGLKHAAPGARAYKDYRALLDNKDVDAVVVCAPLYTHFQIAADALSAGKHVTCEKSMTYSIDEAIQLEQIVNSHSNLKFRVSHEFRKGPVIGKLKQLIKDGVLGQITHIDSRWDVYDNWRREVTDPEFAELINWRLHRKYCGGLMTETITHLVDSVNYILGAHPVKAMSSGSIAYWKDERDTFDNVQTIYEYPGRIHATFSANKASHYEGAYIKIYGDKATVEMQIGGKNTGLITPNPKLSGSEDKVDAVTGASLKIINQSDKKRIRIDSELFDSYGDLMYSYYADTLFGYKHFIDMIVNNAAPDISVTDGRQTAISVLMANLSNRNNTIEYWKPEYGA